MTTTSSYEQLEQLHAEHSPYTVATRVIETLQLITWDLRRVVKNDRQSFVSREQSEVSYIEFDKWLLEFVTDLSHAIRVFECLARAFIQEPGYDQHIRIVNSISKSLKTLHHDEQHKAYGEQAHYVLSLLK